MDNMYIHIAVDARKNSLRERNILECDIYSYKTKSTKLDEKFQKCIKYTITANNTN